MIFEPLWMWLLPQPSSASCGRRSWQLDVCSPGFKHAATALYLQDVYDGRTIAQFKELIDTALVQHAVKDVGGAGAGTDAVPSFLPISLGGFPL